MATPGQPPDSGNSAPGLSDAALERRKRELEAKLAAGRVPPPATGGGSATRGLSGMGYALRLSSEFIAAIVVGGLIGWGIDYFAGTSPWGLVIFLLLGFVAGVLNVLRSAGLVAQSKVGGPGDTGRSAGGR